MRFRDVYNLRLFLSLFNGVQFFFDSFLFGLCFTQK